MELLNFYAITDSGRRIDFECKKQAEISTYVLSHEAFADAKSITVKCDDFNAKFNDEGYYVLPTKNGGGLVRFIPREDSETISSRAKITLLGVVNKCGAYAIMPEIYYDFEFAARCKDGTYSAEIIADFTEQPPVDDIVLNVKHLPVGSDYNDIAAALRDYRISKGEIKPLKEKCANREELDYARKYPLLRIRMAWKPAPPPVLHQTVENEPPLHVACDFARVREIADELKRQGVEGITLSLVGWNISGHDGRWPQVFPVEEKLGGKEELLKTIKHVQSLGYRITAHHNTLDHYEIANNFDGSKLLLTRDKKFGSSGDWSGGHGYRACLKYQVEIAKKQFKEISELGFKGLHYCDVLTIIPTAACFHPDHPYSTREGKEYIKEIMRLSTENFGGFSSEGCYDFALGELDFSLYNNGASFPVTDKDAIVDEYIPLWELAYHGITLYNPYTSTVNSGIKGPDSYNTQVLFDAIPTYYYYTKFYGNNHWMGDLDLCCDTEEQLKESVRVIADNAKAYSARCNRQFEYMKSFTKTQNDLYVAKYETATVVANYNDTEREYEGKTVPAHSYIEL